ncbi:MAG: 2-dehydropantoate 2-reductase [Candidatus Thorarchaeota archaeon]|nr:MAG: 2-dehydropantoate 2-reductase [Candidatus Thorarchaeota archaeon]
MKIVVLGSGSIGSLYGAFLSTIDDNEVILVGRNPHVAAIRASGLQILGIMGEYKFHLNAVEDVSEIEEADLILLTTKTYDTIPAIKTAKHLIERGAYVMLIQNGLGTEEQVAEELNTTKVLRATTCMGALRIGPGIVDATGCGLTELGSRYPENYDFVMKMTNMLNKCGFNVLASENIEGVVWTKTLVNCGINPVGALTGFKNGDVYKNPQLRGLVIRLVEEAVEVVKALGIELTTEDPVRYALGTAKATGDNINSMLQDIQAGKRTEIDSITGEIIRLGKELGIETPSNESVYALIKAIESKYLENADAIVGIKPLKVEELVDTMTTS